MQDGAFQGERSIRKSQRFRVRSERYVVYPDLHSACDPFCLLLSTLVVFFLPPLLSHHPISRLINLPTNKQVEEETGFDLTGRINPKEFHQTQISAQTVTMFIVGGIDEGTVFETQTRKEIGVCFFPLLSHVVVILLVGMTGRNHNGSQLYRPDRR